MLRMFNNLNQLYEKEKSLLIYTILNINQGKIVISKIHQSLLQKKVCFADETNRTSQENSDSYKSNSNAKKVRVMKQVAVKSKMLECIIVG